MQGVIYVRQSLDTTGTALGVTRQLEDTRRLAAVRGVTVVAEYSDNDISAAGTERRPGFEAVLEAIESGKAKAVIAWDMSRLTRNRRDTVRIVETGQKHGIVLMFARGSDMDLSTPSGRLAAEILASVARHEIELKGDRQRRANLQAAEQGRRVGGRRPFGYEADGVTIRPDEAAALKAAYEAVIAGVSLAQICRDLNAKGFRTPQPRRDGSQSCWRPQSLGLTLLNPRYAGLRACGIRPEHGRKRWQIVGRAVWPAIVSEEVWRAAEAILRSPERRTPARSGIGLLTGIAECGVCGAKVHQGGADRPGKRIYRCRGSLGHLSRLAAPVDEYVSAVVVARLSRPDARDLLADRRRPDVAQLQVDAAAIAARLRELAEMFGAGEMTRVEYQAASKRAKARLAEIEAALADAGRLRVLGPLVDGDAQRVWDAMDVERRRAVIEILMRVVLHPPGRGTKRFRPETVEIVWAD